MAKAAHLCCRGRPDRGELSRISRLSDHLHALIGIGNRESGNGRRRVASELELVYRRTASSGVWNVKTLRTGFEEKQKRALAFHSAGERQGRA